MCVKSVNSITQSLTVLISQAGAHLDSQVSDESEGRCPPWVSF